MKKSTLGLAVIAAFPMFSSVQVLAAEDSAQAIEKIQVTGSRIKRADMETASPVTIIGADDIAASGAVSVDSVLQKMTATGGAMTNPGINNGSGGNASIDLRGLGSQRTLVLVNGRRMINSGTGAASTVDLNTIPVSMIKHIEVLKDGASAVYGTDAVAGVVNIILKDNFEGLDLNVKSAITTEGDADETSFDITMGGNFGRGNVVIGLQYTDRGDASQADRSFSDCPLTEDGDGSAPYCSGSSYTPNGHVWSGDESLQGQADNGWHDFGTSDAYNYSQSSYLYTPMRRLNLTGIGSFDLTDDTRLYSEFTYSKRWSEQQLAPQPVWFDFDYAEWMGDSLIDQNINYGDEVSYGRRMVDTGTRDSSQVVDTVRSVIGASGYLDNGLEWDTSVIFGRNDSVDRLSNLHNMGSIQSEIEAGNFNPLSQASWSSSSFSDYVYTEQNSGGSQLFMITAALSGELMEVPAGFVGFAAGLERREEKAWYTPDSITSQGLANDPRVDATSGRFDVNEAYLELAIPLVADAYLAQNVELSAAIRAFDYSTFGSDETWKLGLTWRVNDELMLRGVRSTAFRAPTVAELYSGDSPSYEQVSFTGAQDQAEVTVGGNDQLTPELADTVTVGVVYEPEWFEGFSMTLDYYDIEIENAIATVNNQYIVDSCLATDGSLANQSTALCSSANIDFNQSTGRIAFNNQLQNVGYEQTKGYDLNLNYKFDLAGLAWNTSLDVTYLDEYTVDVIESSIDYAGLITSGIGGYADVKANFELDVKGDAWSANYKARYIAGMDSYSCLGKESTCYAPTTPSVVYHDVSGSYFISDMVSLTAGVNNLFDKQPPYYSGNNDSNTDPYTYDVLGRRVFAGVNVKF
ncbi:MULTISPECIES: TonB-dependent receptor [Pseudoalteromonas]|jgi:iron complex outermembrane receptor protein|uniref:TonB-dependent receptor n=1 Tax=Pseudoalteromonas TaxID=53246 RepID=UPI0003FA94E0|nr:MULTISPECIES: TonB-dependent receptor [Pseudoalteromonas]TVU71631.1 TonB-dependent receptor [Pseudoalteromonas elyakovii]|tara:strand:+ start:3836 stop:6418 length:2583 start_codon:yes stop_codon:yes gene_type:complete